MLALDGGDGPCGQRVAEDPEGMIRGRELRLRFDFLQASIGRIGRAEERDNRIEASCIRWIYRGGKGFSCGRTKVVSPKEDPVQMICIVRKAGTLVRLGAFVKDCDLCL